MEDLYQDHIIDHYKNPRNIGSITQKKKGAKLMHLRAANTSCGDEIQMDVLTVDGLIVELKWRGNGCAISQASMSILSEWMLGKKLEDLRGLTKSDLLAQMGMEEITATREKCLILPLQLLI